MTVQAKVRCTGKRSFNASHDPEGKNGMSVEFSPVYSDNPESPNYTWSKYTPSGTIALNITNPAA